MVTVARIPRYTARLDSTVFILAFAEDAEFIDSKTAVVQQAVDQVTRILLYYMHTLRRLQCSEALCVYTYMV
jgi:hypothetical protein